VVCNFAPFALKLFNCRWFMHCPFRSPPPSSFPPRPILLPRRVARFYVTRVGGSEQVAGAFSFESGSASLQPLQQIAAGDFFTSTYNGRKAGTAGSQRGGSPGRASLLSRDFPSHLVAPHLSPLRFGFLCRSPGKYNRVQSSGRPTRNFSATILHEKCPMKVKRHGIRPHRRLSVLGEEKGEQRVRAKPARPSGQPA
jgi:hypothetical protein